MSTWTVVLAWLGLAAGSQVVLLVLVLLERVHRPLREIMRYADDTLAAGLGIQRNLAAVGEAARTRELTRAIAGALGRDNA